MVAQRDKVRPPLFMKRYKHIISNLLTKSSKHTDNVGGGSHCSNSYATLAHKKPPKSPQASSFSAGGIIRMPQLFNIPSWSLVQGCCHIAVFIAGATMILGHEATCGIDALMMFVYRYIRCVAHDLPGDCRTFHVRSLQANLHLMALSGSHRTNP